MSVPTVQGRTSLGTVLVLDDGADTRPPAPLAAAADQPLPPEPAGRLPLGRLGALAASAAFAFWTSLSCFVC